MMADERAKMPLIVGNWKACFLFVVISMSLAIARCLQG